MTGLLSELCREKMKLVMLTKSEVETGIRRLKKKCFPGVCFYESSDRNCCDCYSLNHKLHPITNHTSYFQYKLSVF